MADTNQPRPLNVLRRWIVKVLRRWIADVLCWCVLAVAFTWCARMSWRTWPDILVDFGQELYVPWRLASGDVLYRDIAWITGPLPQYYHALLFGVFGVSLTTLIASNLVFLVVILAMLYSIFKTCGTRGSATAVCTFFLVVFAFAQYSLIGNYNYICPYRHDMTHGLLLGLANLLCVSRFAATRGIRWLLASGALLGLVSLTKIEMTLAAGLTTAVAIVVCAWRGDTGTASPSDATSVAAPQPNSVAAGWVGRLKNVVGWSAIVASSAGVPIIIAVATLAGPLGWMGAASQIFFQYRLALTPQLSAASGFYRAVSGTDHLTVSLISMALESVVVAAALVFGYGIEETIGRLRFVRIEETVGRFRFVRIWAVLIGIAACWIGFAYVPLSEWKVLPTCLPVVMVPIILLLIPSTRHDAHGRYTVLLLTAVFGIGLLPKILFRVGWVHYGFVLAMPATMVVIHVLLHSIPVLWAQRRRSGLFFQAFFAGLIVACAMSHAVSWIRIDRAKTVPIGDGGDRFYGEPRFDGRTLPAAATLKYLQTHMGKEDSLIVFPNGVMLNYLLRKRNPTPYIMFNPFESDIFGGDNHIADTIIAAQPDYAVVVTMDLEIHGRGNFGSPEFGGRIVKLLQERYEVVDQQSSEWGVEGLFISTVFKRRRISNSNR